MRIAFVAPFYGPHAAGGAESECRHTALRLAARGVAVDVLTTCALDLTHGWDVQVHREGVSADEGVTVRRFLCEPFDAAAFAALHAALQSGRPLTPEQERQFAALHVNSGGLYRYLAAHAADYDRVLYIPYLYGTTLYGTRLCPPGRAVLIPCLHDEPYARLTPVRETFERVGRVVFHTRAEAALAQALYALPDGKGVVLGEGVDLEFPAEAGRFRAKYGLPNPFVLYAGRKDASKNVPALVEAFAAWRVKARREVDLVLIGPGAVPIPAAARGAVRDLGYVPLQDKRDAYAAATVFCQPSLNESFSIVMMEAWSRGVPCLVHGGCAVTRDHVVDAGGGLWFTDAAGFGAALEYLLDRPALCARLGAAGRDYALGRYTWDRIIARYMADVL